jgi:orotate phosphoribosyltransferase
MKISVYSMLPFGKSLLQFLETAINAGVSVSDGAIAIDRDTMAQQIVEKLKIEMKDWQPQINGVAVLDDETKLAAAKFLAGVASAVLQKD